MSTAFWPGNGVDAGIACGFDWPRCMERRRADFEWSSNCRQSAADKLSQAR